MKSIYSNKVWIDQILQPASIQIKGEKISAIIKDKKIKEVKDYGDLIIMPGVIDAHVHINEPGRTEWEGFETATKAAAKGGTTTLVDMPLNSSPVVTTVSAFEKKISAAQGKLSVNCGFYAGSINANIENAIALIKNGCLGVKVFLSHSGIDEFPNISLPDLDKLMAALKPFDVPILAHCELDTLPAESDLINNPTSYQEYLNSHPKEWENEAIRTFVELGKKINAGFILFIYLRRIVFHGLLLKRKQELILASKLALIIYCSVQKKLQMETPFSNVPRPLGSGSIMIN